MIARITAAIRVRTKNPKMASTSAVIASAFDGAADGGR